MKRPLATLVTLLLASTMIVGFATAPVAAHPMVAQADDPCSSTAVGVNTDAVPSVDVTQTVVQVNTGTISQVGSAVSLGGDAVVVQNSNLGQGNANDQC